MLEKLKKARRAAASAVVSAAEKAESVTGESGVLEEEKKTASEIGTEGFRSATRAETDARGAVSLVVALVVGGLMAAFLLPIAIDEIVAVDTTSWTDGAAAMWNILPVMIVLAIFLFFVGVALSKSGKI